MSLRTDLEEVFALLRKGQSSAALARLETLRENIDDADASDRATYFQTLAGVLDRSGRTEEALAAADHALAIDREHWPDGRGTWLTLHSMVLILERLGRRAEAAARATELHELGEKLGGVELAAAAAKRANYLPLADRRVVLERARFACQVAWRERAPQTDSYDLALSWSEVATRLSIAYLELGDLQRAEPPVVEVMPVVAASKAPALRHRFAVLWSDLARVARHRGRHDEQRYFHRCTLANVSDERDEQSVLAALEQLGGRELATDPALDAMRAVRVTGEQILVAHPAHGCFSFARELAPPDLAPFDAVELVSEGQRVRSIVRLSPKLV